MKRGGECGKDVACGDTLCAKQVQVLNLSGAQTQLSLLNRVSPPTRPSPPRVRVGEVQVQLPWPWLCLIPALRSSRDAEEGGSSGRVVWVAISFQVPRPELTDKTPFGISSSSNPASLSSLPRLLLLLLLLQPYPSNTCVSSSCHVAMTGEIHHTQCADAEQSATS